MIAGDLDVTIEQGATFELVVNGVKDDAGVVQNLTGWTFAGQVRDTPQAAATLAVMSFTPIDLTTGKFMATISAEDTADIPVAGSGNPRKAFYDILLTAPDGVTKRRLLRGNAFITPSVTRV